MSLKKRIYGGFIVVFVLTIVVGAIGYFSVDSQIDQRSQMSDNLIPLLHHVDDLKIEALMHRRYEKDFFLNIGKPEKQKKYLSKFEKASGRLTGHLDEIQNITKGLTGISTHTQQTLSQCREAYDDYKLGFLSLSTEVLNNPEITPQQANKDMKPFKDRIYAFEDGIEKLREIGDSYEKASTETAKQSGVMAKRFILIAFGLAGLIAVLISYWIGRNIIRVMKRALDQMSSSAEQVASASGQISGSSQSLAEGTSEQAASIEETSSSLEEMSAMTSQNADNARTADTLMQEANDVIQQANASMSELTNSMEDISKASEETSKIIKTIDEIAFQTNLLALNAAVEAARAGEAGAGFAVVADEVRNLAMRAADAAKNTAELIESTVKKTADGTDLVVRTNEAFGAVSESAGKVGELVAEIAAASKEQSQGIGQVNQAVVEMDKVVQQNAANAEETASASEELNAQADEMKQIVMQLMQLADGRQKSVERDVRTDKGSPPGREERPTHVHPARQSEKAGTATASPALTEPKEIIPLEEDEFKDF